MNTLSILLAFAIPVIVGGIVGWVLYLAEPRRKPGVSTRIGGCPRCGHR